MTFADLTPATAAYSRLRCRTPIRGQMFPQKVCDASIESVVPVAGYHVASPGDVQDLEPGKSISKFADPSVGHDVALRPRTSSVGI